MSIRPTSLLAALNRTDPLREQGNRPPNSNRFLSLRDRSRSSSASGRVPITPTTKRPADDADFPSGKNPRMDANNMIFKNFEKVEANISKTREVLASVRATVLKAALDGPVSEILGGLLLALDNMSETQVMIASAIVDSSASVRKGAGPPPVANRQPQIVPAPVTQPKPPPSAEEVRKKKFVAAVKEAERSVLLFNLDLGKVPIMNTTTISSKVTLDLAAKAAVADGSDNGRPTEETVTMLDDAISLIKGMEFYGKVTKSYSNKNKADDPNNGKFCTLPVKLSFKDKDTKQKVESLLRGRCKVQCTTPYPLNLRKVIKATLDTEKVKYPKEFIQVKVDAEAACLRLSRKAEGKEGKWTNHYDTVMLDTSAMELGRPGQPAEAMEEGGQNTL